MSDAIGAFSREQILARFRNPAAAQSELEQNLQTADIPAEEQESLGLLVLAEAASSADPDRAVSNLTRFMQGPVAPRETLRGLRSQPEILHALMILLGGSQFLSNVLITQPETFEWLFTSEHFLRPRSANVYAAEARAVCQGKEGRLETRKALSDWRKREMLRIGVRDLLSPVSYTH